MAAERLETCLPFMFFTCFLLDSTTFDRGDQRNFSCAFQIFKNFRNPFDLTLFRGIYEIYIAT